MLALGLRLVEARSQRDLRDLGTLARVCGGGRHGVRACARIPGLPHPAAAAWGRMRQSVKAAVPTREAIAARRPDIVVHDILTLAPALAAELEGIPHSDAHPPPRLPVTAPGLRSVLDRSEAAGNAQMASCSGTAFERPSRGEGCGRGAMSSTRPADGSGSRRPSGCMAGSARASAWSPRSRSSNTRASGLRPCMWSGRCCGSLPGAQVDAAPTWRSAADRRRALDLT